MMLQKNIGIPWNTKMILIQLDDTEFKLDTIIIPFNNSSKTPKSYLKHINLIYKYVKWNLNL